MRRLPCWLLALLVATAGVVPSAAVVASAAPAPARPPADGTPSDVYAFGSAAYRGANHGSLAANVVAMAADRAGTGYWLFARDGGVFTFGTAGFFGSTGSLRLAAPIVGAARTPRGRGYWLVASDGGVFSFGDARFRGSTGAMRLNQPI